VLGEISEIVKRLNIEKCGNILMNDNGFVDSDGDITPNSSVLD
jgi:hypothetical protein